MLQLFEFEGKQVRFVGTWEKPEWVAQDICNCLGLTNTSEALSQLDEKDKGIRKVDTPSGEQNMLTVFESGLYALIFKSRKEEAKRFKRWTFEDVLPSIRKTGAYAIETRPKTALELAREQVLLHEQLEEKNKLINMQQGFLKIKDTIISDQDKVLTEQLEILAESEPKVQFYDIFREVETNVPVEIFAKTISNKLDGRFPAIGRNNLFKILRKYQFVRPVRYNPPFQRYVNSGVFTVIQKTNRNLNRGYTQTLITPKGQQELLNWFLKKYPTPEDLKRDLM